MKIRVTSDSTCDLSQELIDRYDIGIIPLFVNMSNKSYRDGVDINPAVIFSHTAKTGELCSTSAVPVGIYEDFFIEQLKSYDALVHVNIGSGFSSCYQNACLAASEMDNVYVVDSKNLSTGQGHVVLELCKLTKQDIDIDIILQTINNIIPRVDASFLLDRLDYMVKGGRCSPVSAFGANLLKLKPCIEVQNNKMVVGKKYRGNYQKCIEKYIEDRLKNATDLNLDTVFITHTVVPTEIDEAAHKMVQECQQFENIYDTVAGCTVSCHCGEGTLGVLYIHNTQE